MRIFIVFFTLVISSCGVFQNELRKHSLCQGYYELSNCTNETSLEEMLSCTESAVQNTLQELNGKKVEISYTQKEELNDSSDSYDDCVLSAGSEIENLIMGTGITEIEMENKYKELLKYCINQFSQKARRILECD